tara:strand:- start:17646 stop:18155 length:510 start_codon:yes stop_codon:yes gene_type:complete
MPNLWETSLPDSDADLYANATTENDWKGLLTDFFQDEDGTYLDSEWGDFWDEQGHYFETQFDYKDQFGANESLARRSYTKGLESYTNQMYGKMQDTGRKRGMQGFAGSGGGLGMQSQRSDMWSDYQAGILQRKNDMNTQMHGYKEQHKSNVMDYLTQLANSGYFEFGDD